MLQRLSCSLLDHVDWQVMEEALPLSLWPAGACRGLRVAKLRAVKNRTVCVAESAAAQAFAKSARFNFYFCFLTLASDMSKTEGCAFAQLDLWPVIMDYT